MDGPCNEPCKTHKVRGSVEFVTGGTVTPALLLRNVQFETFKLGNKLDKLGP